MKKGLMMWPSAQTGGSWPPPAADGTARLWRWQAEDLIQQACSRLPWNLTQAEWRRYLGDLPYRRTCPDLPVPQD